MKLSDLIEEKGSNKQSWKYEKIFDFFVNEKNAKHEILNIQNFAYFHKELKKIEKSDFLEQKSNQQPKKEIRYFLRKLFQNLENNFVTETNKEKQLQILQVIKLFISNFGSTQRINSKLQAKL